MKTFGKFRGLTAPASIWAMVSILAGANQVWSAPQSVLDPYANIQAPAGKNKAVINELPADNTTTYVTVPMDSGESAKPAKVHKTKTKSRPAPAATTADNTTVKPTKPAKAAKSANGGIMDGTRAAGAKIVDGSKAMTDKMAAGTKKMGSGIASGAKTSADYLMKGSKSLGSGFKTAGAHIKDGTEAVGNKLSELPKKIQGKSKNVTATSTKGPILADNKKINKKIKPNNIAVDKQNSVVGKGHTNSKSAEKGLASTSDAASLKGADALKTASTDSVKQNNGKGLIGKTLAPFHKLKLFGHKDNDQSAPATANAVR